MADTAVRPMTVEEFFLWQQRQDDRYELVEGVPVKRLQVSTRHDWIVGNVIAALGRQLGHGPYWPATAGLPIRTRAGTLRRADVLIVSDEPRTDVYEAQKPRMVVEVLSPSNKGLPWQRKLEEYRQHSALVYLLLIESDGEAATLIHRSVDTGQHEDFDGRDAVIDLPAIGCRLAMADVYRGITFPTQE